MGEEKAGKQVPRVPTTNINLVHVFWVIVCWCCPQDKSLEKTNVKIDWNKFVDEDEEEGGGIVLVVVELVDPTSPCFDGPARGPDALPLRFVAVIVGIFFVPSNNGSMY